MKSKLLLFFLLLFGGLVYAQDTIRTLIITEARMTHNMENYVEITNVGDFPIQLSDFEFGLIRPWNNVPWTPETPERAFMLPEKILNPGESFVISSAYDVHPREFAKGADDYWEKVTKDEIWKISDKFIHFPEAKHGESDSVTSYQWAFETQRGRGAWYIRQHLSESDSVVVDQVGGVFDQENGLNNTEGFYDVAGVTGATGNSVLVRKFSVTQGNVDFANARGIGIDDSEWIPIPIQGGFKYDNQAYGSWRKVSWTLGNHGDYKLDANTLESDVINVDFQNKKLTLPWGIRSNDDVMSFFKPKPGIAWAYHFSPAYEDSLYMTARTGDKLTIYVCGKSVNVATFDIVVEAPPANATMVIPRYNVDPEGSWRIQITQGELNWPRVTRHESGIDTITGARFGIPYATRVDSLLKRLEKAPKASWELVTVDGVNRPDLKDGDVLKVTAEDGTIKEYYIQVQGYRPSHTAELSAITWPDIPEFYRDIFGWKGDTIPGFSPTSYNYIVNVPLDHKGIPALVPKAEDLNTRIDVKRATSLSGNKEQRTTQFIVQAEDDTTFRFYNVEIVREKDIQNIQPYFAEPFISEYVFQYSWGPTCFIEICNPGNQPLDLSNYMIVGTAAADPAVAITTSSAEGDWGTRYNRYVPGYKWVSKNDWSVKPSMIEFDVNVNPIVQPGDVFVLGNRHPNHTFRTMNEIDIDFVGNPWGEFIHPYGQTVVRRWANHNFYLFKILNDSIKKGLKPVIDATDFELIEIFGTGDGSMPNLGMNFDQTSTTIRKPDYTVGRKGFKESFDNYEFEHKPFLGYWIPNGIGNKEVVTWDLGTHFFNEPNHYKSTITSIVYKVSEGYKTESLRGPKPGATAGEVLSNIIKVHDGQSLKIVGKADGTVLAPDALVAMNDTLIVLSADSTNTTRYVIDVSENGLSSNALLTSNRYTIKITANPKSSGDNHGNAGTGEIRGFEYGTSIKTVLANITVPHAAQLNIIDDKNAFIPLQKLNFDTVYVFVTVNSNTFFEVLAEDGVTRIIYQLIPETSESDAFVTSDVYEVLQKDEMVKLVPRGTNVNSFLSNLVASEGASVVLVDKYGNERLDGYVADDDKVVVTSSNGLNRKVYFISKLSTKYIPETLYLAYIQSKVYAVNQVKNQINGVSTTETLASFYSKINTSPGATAMVITKDGKDKTTGDIDAGDRVKVVAADGKTTTYYTFGQLTGADFNANVDFGIYPNPTSGKLNVSGLKAGQKIEIFNSSGIQLQYVSVTQNIESLDFSNQPAGIYFIVISDTQNMLARFKAVKR